MDNETLFYVCGIVLAVSAVVFTFVGLKLEDFPGKAAPVVIVWFAVFVLGSTTFGVRYSQEHETAHAAELEHAGEEIEKEESSGPFEEAEEEAHEDEAGEEAASGRAAEEEKAEKAKGKKAGAGGGEETIQLAADEAALAYDTTTLSAKAGSLTIDLDNPAPIEHDVAIERDGEEIAKSEVVTEAETSLTADVEAGDYTFFCSVPGHREAGMEGTLTVE